MRALVLGGTGAVGRRTSAELARKDEVTDLIVGGRDYEPLRRFTSRLGDKVRPALVEAEGGEQLADACRRVDVVVNCAGPTHLIELPVLTAAIDAGVSYVSLCNDFTGFGAATELDGRARTTGSTAVPGCGLAPGVTTMLVALARDELDDVEEVEISLGLSYGNLPTSAHTAHLLQVLRAPVASISDQELSVERFAGSPHLVYFPEPVGWVETVACSHPDVHSSRSPGLRSLTVRLGLTEKAAMDALRALATTHLSSINVAQRALAAAHSLPPRGPQWSAARIDVVGRSRGRTTTVSLGVVDHLVNLASGPLSLAAVKLGSERRDPGVKSPTEAFDHREFLAALGKHGTRVARLEPVPL